MVFYIGKNSTTRGCFCAVNGTITFQLSKWDSSGAPKASDFKVTRSIDGGQPTDVALTDDNVSVADDGVTVTLTVDQVAATDKDQSVVYTVNGVKADAFTVKAAQKAPTVTGFASVNAVQVNEGSSDVTNLPTTVTENLSDGTTKDVAVTWDKSSLNLNKVGTYTLTGTVDGTTQTASVNVVVVDKTAPVIKLVGDTSAPLPFGTAYNTDGTAVVTDNNDQNLQPTVAITDAAGNPVTAIDGKTPGSYTVTYTATDAAGNKATPVTRTVVVAAPAVSSVGTITKTSVKVTLASAPAADFTNADAKNFDVEVNGKAVVPTAVAKDTTDASGKTYTLTVPSLDGQEGTLSVNGVEPTTMAGTNSTFEFDFAKPTIASVKALDSKTLLVTYSEKVDSTTALNASNYGLYNAATGAVTPLGSDVGAKQDHIATTLAFANADQTQVKVNITGVGTTVTGYPVGGLSNGQYVLYVSGVNDVASTANTIVANSNSSFTGTLAPSATAPNLVSASYDTGLGQLVLNFDKAPQAVSTTDGAKYTITNGSNSVTLTGDAGSVVNTTGLQFSLTADQQKALGALQDGASVTVAAGGVQDANGNANSGSLQASLQSLVRPSVTGASFDESTDQLTVNFSQPVDLSSVNIGDFTVQYSTDGKNYSSLAALTSGHYTVSTTGTTSNSVTFKLDNTAIAAITAQRATKNVTYQIAVSDNAVKNASGVSMQSASGTTTAAMTYNENTTAPTVQSADFYTTADAANKIAANTVYVQFSAPLQGTLVNSDIQLQYGSTPTKVDLTSTDVSNVNLSSDGKTLSFVVGGSTLTALAAADASTLKVNVLTGNGYTDVNGNALGAQSVALGYHNNAKVSALTAAAHSATQIYVAPTGNDLDANSAQNANNFKVYVKSNPNVTVPLASADYISTSAGKQLVLTAATGSSLASNTDYVVAYSNLKDTNGLAITDGTTELLTGSSVSDAVNPTLSSAVFNDADNSNSVTQGDQVTLTFNEPVKVPQSTSLQAQFGKGATVAQGAHSNQLVITLGSTPTLALGSAGTALTDNGVTDVTGNAYAGGDKVAFPAAATQPTVKSAVFADANNDGSADKGDTLTVKFNGDISKSTLANLTNGDFTGEGTLTFDSAKLIDNSTVQFTIENAGNFAVGTTTLDVNGINDFANSWGQSANTSTPVTVTSADTTHPTLVSAVYNDNGVAGNDPSDTVVLTFSKPIHESGLAASDFTFGNGALASTGSPTFVQTGANQITVNLTGTTGTDIINGYTTVQLTNTAVAKISDASENVVSRTAPIALQSSAVKVLNAAHVAASAGTTGFTVQTVESNGQVNLMVKPDSNFDYVRLNFINQDNSIIYASANPDLTGTTPEAANTSGYSVTKDANGWYVLSVDASKLNSTFGVKVGVDTGVGGRVTDWYAAPGSTGFTYADGISVSK